MTTYTVSALQACEPDELASPPDGVTVTIHDDTDSMGFARVDVTAPTRAALLAYVWDQWGGGDEAWWQDYVIARVERVGAAPPPRSISITLDVTLWDPALIPAEAAEFFAAYAADCYPAGISLDGWDVRSDS